jgi:hypothetical protein
MAATSSTAARNAASLAFEGLLKPLSFLTNCNEAERISSSVTGGSKLKRVLMLLHTSVTSRYQKQLKRESYSRRLSDMLPGKGIEHLAWKRASRQASLRGPGSPLAQQIPPRWRRTSWREVLFYATASGDLVLSTAGQRFGLEGSGVSFPVMRSIAIAQTVT